MDGINKQTDDSQLSTAKVKIATTEDTSTYFRNFLKGNLTSFIFYRKLWKY